MWSGSVVQSQYGQNLFLHLSLLLSPQPPMYEVGLKLRSVQYRTTTCQINAPQQAQQSKPDACHLYIQSVMMMMMRVYSILNIKSLGSQCFPLFSSASSHRILQIGSSIVLKFSKEPFSHKGSFCSYGSCLHYGVFRSVLVSWFFIALEHRSFSEGI